MCTSSTITVGTRLSVGCWSLSTLCCSATAILLLRLPEVDVAADTHDQGPADRRRPDVRRQLRGGDAVDQREAHQIDVDRGGVDVQQDPYEVRGAAGELVDAVHDAGH